MSETSSPCATAYRLLRRGEIIQGGDEWPDRFGKWQPAHSSIGESANDMYRRPITGGAGLYESATCPQTPPPEPPSAGPRANDDLCAFGEILVGERPVESPYNAEMPVDRLCERIRVAAEEMSKDWVTPGDHRSAPCFHIDIKGRFCADAEHWHGSHSDHSFVSLAALIASVATLAADQIEAAHAACDGPVARLSMNMRERPLAERVSTMSQMLAAAWREIPEVEPPLTEEECRDLDGLPVSSGLPVILAFFVGAIVGVFLARAFLSIQ